MTSQQSDLLEKAIQALHNRTFFAGFPEHPKAYPEDGDAEGRKAFSEQLNKKFEELSDNFDSWIGEEVSPYTKEPLGITYTASSAPKLINNAESVFSKWSELGIEKRASILLDSLDGFASRFFEVAYATMHTTGQGYMMAFQASGPHAADRALEAIASSFEEIKRFPDEALWDKPMGKFNIVLQKEWRAVPRGISLAIGCSTFPIWNTVPGVYASLMTGNPVIIKPHPGAILPLAIVVSELRKALKASGLPENVVQMAPDTRSNPIALILAERTEIKIIDFTGNSHFGSQLESLSQKEVFTEKTGVNSAIIDSVADAEKVAANLAFSLCLYSGQMCTAPQNIFIPEDGIETGDGKMSFDDFADLFRAQVIALVDNPKAGPFVLGAIQNQATCDRIPSSALSGTKLLLQSRAVENPLFPKSRTVSPAILVTDSAQEDIYNSELFGPIAVIVKTKSSDESVEIARNLAQTQGAISCALYCTHPSKRKPWVDSLVMAGAPVSINLVGPIYVNQHAGFSDFHVTGANPAGNASFTDPKFVLRRFNWVGTRTMD